ncbi:MAG TPA: TPM domain-containing protein [Caulobacteraceae bacterium]|jgi:putative membrane protein|nr:TPM domain-containing protein [Caulobacteraceae bacterium]
MLTDEDRTRIAAAVETAEAGTSGEIVCVFAEEVSHYPEVALALAAIAALVIPSLAIGLGLHPLGLFSQAGLWTAVQGSAREGQVAMALGLYAAAQALLFILVFLLVEIPPVRRAATPAILKRHRVERAARQQFAAIAARAQGSDTGVLIFVAPIDRQVRILVDPALHSKADDAAWARAAAAIGRAMKSSPDPTSGVIEAIAICGEPLKAHFPSEAAAHVFKNGPLEV